MGNPNGWYLESLNEGQRGFLLKLTTGENLVSISLTTFEKFKIEDFVSSFPHLVGKKILDVLPTR